jgi:hypothetical protein
MPYKKLAHEQPTVEKLDSSGKGLTAAEKMLY